MIRPLTGVGAGLEVSRGHLFEKRVIERLVCHQLLELRVLSLELLEWCFRHQVLVKRA